MGPNVKKLIIHKASIDAVPSGSGPDAAILFLTDPRRIADGMRIAAEWVSTAILVVREASEPNPWKNASDEEIAEEILRQIEVKKRSKK